MDGANDWNSDITKEIELTGDLEIPGKMSKAISPLFSRLEVFFLFEEQSVNYKNILIKIF